ncbi:hypothetical protein BKA65DRAFT_30278 [Rhexocercosporidium sp. MPI-PUGE-AT-0058]|nr:hypothetical protein BKA65DRAFT_30278 [Rhexocercosporidium sp. MPI-PUGE-AT-0058]
MVQYNIMFNRNAQATPNTEEVDRVPPYQAAADEGKPPPYSARPRSFSEPVPTTQPAHSIQSTQPIHPTEASQSPPAPVCPGVTRFNSFAALPDRPTQKTRDTTRTNKWATLLFFIVLASAGLFVGLYVSLVVNRRHSNKHNSAADTPYTPPAAPISTVYDLSATECEPGTFVFHQDMYGGIWLQGEFHDAMWRNSSSMLPLKLNFAGTLSPQKPANMTAVCWSVPELNIARIALYFISPFPDPVTKYAIIESIVDIYTTNFTLVDYPAFSDTHRMIIRTPAASSLVAVVLPSEGVRLYYQEKRTSGKKIDITEVSRGWAVPVVGFDNRAEASRLLDVEAHSTGTALTAAGVGTNDGTMSAEVHIFFVDSESRLSRVVRVGSETYPPQPLTQRVDDAPWDVSIRKMAAIIPHINKGIPEPDLFFITDSEVKNIFGAVEVPSGYTAASAPLVYIDGINAIGKVPSSAFLSIPKAVEIPPLIAVTCWNFEGNRTMGVDVGGIVENRERMQIFYVRVDTDYYDNGQRYDNVQSLGKGIVRVTARAAPFVGYSDDWGKGNNVTMTDG